VFWGFQKVTASPDVPISRSIRTRKLSWAILNLLFGGGHFGDGGLWSPFLLLSLVIPAPKNTFLNVKSKNKLFHRKTCEYRRRLVDGRRKGTHGRRGERGRVCACHASLWPCGE
jgi:hypothetical protein